MYAAGQSEMGLLCAFFLKKHKLFKILRLIREIRRSDQKFNRVVLPFGDDQHSDGTVGRQSGQNAFPMGFYGVPSITDPGING